MTEREGVRNVRILGTAVAPLFDPAGPVYVFIVGEAPGPRGADKSGIPFFGDAAGEHLYQMLESIGAAELPAECDHLPWKGSIFRERGLTPVVHGVAIGNAWDRCPSDDGVRFRAPARTELEGDENIGRLRSELRTFLALGLRGVVTLGKVATRTMARALDLPEFSRLVRRSVPHPSAQGLLSMAPHRGKGAVMSQLRTEWSERCMAAVREAGWERLPLAHGGGPDR